MKTVHTFTEEEYKVVEEAITRILSLYMYSFIEANNGNEYGISMSKEAFFILLKRLLTNK